MSVVSLDANRRRKPAAVYINIIESFHPSDETQTGEYARAELAVRVFRSEDTADYVECQFETMFKLHENMTFGEMKKKAVSRAVEAIGTLSKETPESLEQKIQDTFNRSIAELSEIGPPPAN